MNAFDSHNPKKQCERSQRLGNMQGKEYTVVQVRCPFSGVPWAQSWSRQVTLCHASFVSAANYS